MMTVINVTFLNVHHSLPCPTALSERCGRPVHEITHFGTQARSSSAGHHRIREGRLGHTDQRPRFRSDQRDPGQRRVRRRTSGLLQEAEGRRQGAQGVEGCTLLSRRSERDDHTEAQESGTVDGPGFRQEFNLHRHRIHVRRAILVIGSIMSFIYFNYKMLKIHGRFSIALLFYKIVIVKFELRMKKYNQKWHPY